MSCTQVFDSLVLDAENTEDPSSGSKEKMLIPKVRQPHAALALAAAPASVLAAPEGGMVFSATEHSQLKKGIVAAAKALGIWMPAAAAGGPGQVATDLTPGV